MWSVFCCPGNSKPIFVLIYGHFRILKSTYFIRVYDMYNTSHTKRAKISYTRVQHQGLPLVESGQQQQRRCPGAGPSN